MKILVQKFGGTSVSTHERRQNAVGKILDAKKNGYSPVVVVSAMGRKGQPYATDTLLSLLSSQFKSKNKFASDLIMSCGEVISTVVMSDEISKCGFKAFPFMGGQASVITDDNYGDASVLNVDGKNLIDVMKQDGIPVVAGFQGMTKKGFITTLGRGGSDVTAVLLGNALAAERVEIYTDVDGIMTADPRIVKDASLIKNISYNEVFQLADQGAKVIHPRAVKLAMESSIPLVIKNTMNDVKGTVISNYMAEERQKPVSGITSMKNRIQITLKYNKNATNENYDSVFDELADKMISIDLINVFPKEKIFTIGEDDAENFKIVMENLGLEYSVIHDCTKIAVIGNGMRGIPGVMAKILKILSKENIQVLQTADSHTTIWCLVDGKMQEKAINALHRGFNLNCK